MKKITIIKSLTKQEDPFGCGIACVAAIVGTSYAKAKDLFDKKENAETRGFFCKEISLALLKMGHEYKLKKADRFKEKLKEGDIVFIKRDKNYPHGHFLVKIGPYWMDSWVNLPNVPVEAGFRRKLPGTPQYILRKIDK